MTREEFKDMVLNILLNENGVLFDAKDINHYKLVQCDIYDEDEWYVDGDIPLDEFLDKLYEVINNGT